MWTSLDAVCAAMRRRAQARVFDGGRWGRIRERVDAGSCRFDKRGCECGGFESDGS
ncbi:hypothetical protein GLE_3282 [Lysobacter enzymogenes]|uniref:Uncharacterized protein n=1 Tax=Lysobacter enzymogenes TaxID=69 RepID=A0A0S2DJC8_LYSEN|nr:hypothetical protein GLE_3282 [Lysobacter enzymogenes]